MCRSHDRCLGEKVTENILPNYTCIIHPVRRINFIYKFVRKPVELRKFSLKFQFFCKLGKDHNYPVSVAGHLSLLEHHCSTGADLHSHFSVWKKKRG
jgi:hypothetical protein